MDMIICCENSDAIHDWWNCRVLPWLSL